MMCEAILGDSGNDAERNLHFSEKKGANQHRSISASNALIQERHRGVP
jgi:hypothetical protein